MLISNHLFPIEMNRNATIHPNHPHTVMHFLKAYNKDLISSNLNRFYHIMFQFNWCAAPPCWVCLGHRGQSNTDIDLLHMEMVSAPQWGSNICHCHQRIKNTCLWLLWPRYVCCCTVCVQTSRPMRSNFLHDVWQWTSTMTGNKQIEASFFLGRIVFVALESVESHVIPQWAC